MIKLEGFDGTSSADADSFDRRSSYSSGDADWYFLVYEFTIGLLVEIWKGVRGLWRKRRVRKLREEILPRFPKSLICPLCHEIARRN